MLADHRPAGSILPIYEVKDLAATERALKRAGWKPEGPAFQVPNGPVLLLRDAAGIEIALLQDSRPGVMDAMAGRGV